MLLKHLLDFFCSKQEECLNQFSDNQTSSVKFPGYLRMYLLVLVADKTKSSDKFICFEILEYFQKRIDCLNAFFV